MQVPVKDEPLNDAYIDYPITIKDEPLNDAHIDYTITLKDEPLNDAYIDYTMQIILKDEPLNDAHIDYFGSLLKNCSDYQPRESWEIQCPDLIEPVFKDQKHIQLLYSCSDTISNSTRHWVCSYYDKRRIYIYDSLNLKQLPEHYKVFLDKLYPFHPFKKKPVVFPKVQEQSSSNDSGVFAIAFAVSLLFNVKPDTVMYDKNLMREHLRQMFQLKKLEHFPRIIRPGDPPKLFSLEELRRRRILADKRRERRQRSKKRKESSVNFQEQDDIIINKEVIFPEQDNITIKKEVIFPEQDHITIKEVNFQEQDNITIKKEVNFQEQDNITIKKEVIFPEQDDITIKKEVNFQEQDDITIKKEIKEEILENYT
ncbi:PREDICTED: uncharacterized protein LOC105451500 [Wasmannia auropunctata]|uniref:uncharacterized protein LOC105451500 n=1 Tax=Wasmannia auropunctata TaxID=64793 RepID=UPI0005EFAC8C|nr:PREDICTED: uncharacterized protein LOC105451500 [Wasmannia auropunctata]